MLGLAQLIAPHVDIGVMKIVRNKKKRVAKGYAFVGTVTETAAMAALDGELMGDRQLTVKLAALEAAVPATDSTSSPSLPYENCVVPVNPKENCGRAGARG
ncbi:MAG: hypothetical protein EOP54_27940 [Sphingobacteriales bacterium]|nr:MAG: hypothetical protein EOP54_27940 [Sphingobacteriales bacterium]